LHCAWWMAHGWPWTARLHARRPACRLAVPKTEQAHFTRRPPPPTTRPTPSDPRTLAHQHHRAGNAAHGSLQLPCNRSCTGLAMPAPQYCASSPISVVTVPVSMQVKPLPPCKHSKQMRSVNCTHPGKSGATTTRWQSRWPSRQRLSHWSPTSYSL
jgi:hypothetical protein